MPGSMKVTGTDELSDMLGKLSEEAESIAAQALYEGARVVADAYKRAVDSIQTEPYRRWGTESHQRLAWPEEKAALKGLGIAKFVKSGGAEINTLIGAADGYATVDGKKRPIKLIARSINSGTSFMVKQPVFRKAVSGSKKAAQQAMADKAEELIEKLLITSGNG